MEEEMEKQKRGCLREIRILFYVQMDVTKKIQGRIHFHSSARKFGSFSSFCSTSRKTYVLEQLSADLCATCHLRVF